MSLVSCELTRAHAAEPTPTKPTAHVICLSLMRDVRAMTLSNTVHVWLIAALYSSKFMMTLWLKCHWSCAS